MANVIFFSAQFNNNSNKKNYPIHKFNPTQPNSCGLGWTYVMSWVRLNFFLPTIAGWVKKFPQLDPIIPMHTPKAIPNQTKRRNHNYIDLRNIESRLSSTAYGGSCGTPFLPLIMND